MGTLPGMSLPGISFCKVPFLSFPLFDFQDRFGQEYRFVEFFAGESNLTWAMKNWGLAGLCFDVGYGGRYNDFFEPSGFASLTSKS